MNKDAAVQEKQLAKMAEFAEVALIRAMNEVTDLLAKNQLVGSYQMTELARAQYERAIHVEIMAEAAASGTSLGAAAVKKADYFVKRYMRQPGESRSTSQMSNVMEDIQRAVEMQFARDWTSYEGLNRYI